ncbi:iron-containing alcohol dehydrogenase family protein [Luedemannella helvata]|uniref:Iron-containing alcohol dehydrogenase family protein n=1 Tax=Luedemannella helvata TaxID=349315 RepID=A0ABP4WIP8_9ACTN
MPLLARTVTTPLAIDIRRGAVADLGKMLADRRISAGGDVAIVVGPGQGERVAELLRPSLDRADVFTVSGGSVEAALDLGEKIRAGSYDAVVGIGGGKTIDTAKYAATRYALPMVSVATSLAHDGIASPVAALDHDGGKGSYGVHIPIAVVVDLDFVVAGPRRQTRAGIGDALSNLSAVADWELANRFRQEPLDGLALTLARTSAEALLHHPGRIGRGAEDNTQDDFLRVLAEALVLGGLAMSVCGSSRPSSGGCHEISHAIDHLYPHTAAHGEQVGLGALFCTYLRVSRGLEDVGRFTQLSDALSRHGLPRVPTDLGLSVTQFAEAVLHAPGTRPDRYTILEHVGFTADEALATVKEYVDAVGD